MGVDGIDVGHIAGIGGDCDFFVVDGEGLGVGFGGCFGDADEGVPEAERFELGKEDLGLVVRW